MLSLGIEASLAFCTARPRAALVFGSPPPSFAATVIARASFVKSLPRRESTIAFLCLIPAHLECPAMTSDDSPQRLVEPRVVLVQVGEDPLARGEAPLPPQPLDPALGREVALGDRAGVDRVGLEDEVDVLRVRVDVADPPVVGPARPEPAQAAHVLLDAARHLDVARLRDAL